MEKNGGLGSEVVNAFPSRLWLKTKKRTGIRAETEKWQKKKKDEGGGRGEPGMSAQDEKLRLLKIKSIHQC